MVKDSEAISETIEIQVAKIPIKKRFTVKTTDQPDTEMVF